MRESVPVTYHDRTFRELLLGAYILKACFIRSYTVWSRVWLVHLSKTTYIEDSTLHTYAYGYFAYHDK